MEPLETEAIDRLFLELSQFTTAQTKKEIELQDRLDRITRAIEQIVVTEGEDTWVVLVDHESPTRYDADLKCHIYVHENFSPLGDALVKLWQITQED